MTHCCCRHGRIIGLISGLLEKEAWVLLQNVRLRPDEAQPVLQLFSLCLSRSGHLASLFRPSS